MFPQKNEEKKTSTKVIVALEDRTPDLISNSKDQQAGMIADPKKLKLSDSLLGKKHIPTQDMFESMIFSFPKVEYVGSLVEKIMQGLGGRILWKVSTWDFTGKRWFWICTQLQ